MKTVILFVGSLIAVFIFLFTLLTGITLDNGELIAFSAIMLLLCAYWWGYFSRKLVEEREKND